MIRDLGSRNGTYINGNRVAHGPVGPADVLRIGDSIGVLTKAANQGPSWEIEDLGDGLLGGPEFFLHLAALQRVAASDLPIQIVGATGTGKERVARAVHSWSGRRGPFCAVNCAALPAGLAEAELFGFRKGAFTGADHSHLGHFREANGGTLFLDEIADLSLEVQAKLLRAIEENRVRGLGQTTSHAIDVHFVAAAQKPLDDLVKLGRFRDDLAARLSGLVVELPPLSQRKTEIIQLFKIFVHKYGQVRPDFDVQFAEALLLYDWPRNVRELELLARRLVALHGTSSVWSRDLLPVAMQPVAERTSLGEARTSLKALRAEQLSARREAQVAQIVDAVQISGGNIAAAAARLGISRQRAYRLLPDSSVERALARTASEADNPPESGKT